jgi:hypothetical protein
MGLEDGVRTPCLTTDSSEGGGDAGATQILYLTVVLMPTGLFSHRCDQEVAHGAQSVVDHGGPALCHGFSITCRAPFRGADI